MKIGLIDVDGHNFPNVPLMKISAYFKILGANVEFYNAIEASASPYDKVFMSKVFTFTDDYEYPIYAKEIMRGGTGYDMISKLPPQNENIYPDYELYGLKDTAYGFLTRGCPRKCEFCIVSIKEGCKTRKVANLNSFWRTHKHIKLLDPNLLACEQHSELLQQLIDSRAWIDFTQGLDIRLMNEDITELLMKCRIKMLHFAWDNDKDSSVICRKLREFKKQTQIDMRKARVYILTNFDTDFEFDLYRVYELKNIGFDPYVMIYNKHTAPDNVRKLQRWVNNKIIFRSGKAERFEDYNPKIG